MEGMKHIHNTGQIAPKDRDGFRRFITRAFARSGVILGTHYVDKYTGETKEIARKVDSLPVWAEIRRDEKLAACELLYVNPATRSIAWVTFVSGCRSIRLDMDCGGKGKSRQPLPIEISGEAYPELMPMPSEMPDQSYMVEDAVAPLLRKEKRKSAAAAKAEILRLAEEGNSAGLTAARILLGGATWQKVAAEDEIGMRKIGQQLDLVKRRCATIALEANR